MECIILGYSVILWGCTVLFDLCFCSIFKSRREYEHELGHAEAAKSFQLPVLILMQNGKTNRIQNEIPCYKVTKKDFKEICNKTNVVGVTFYDNVETISYDQSKEITEAGPMSERKWLMSWKRQVPVLIVLFLLLLIPFIACTRYIDLWVRIMLMLIIPVPTHFACMQLRLAISMGMRPKKEINKFKKDLEGKKKGEIFQGGVCDSAKLNYWNTFVECLEIIKKNELKPEKSYKDVLKELKDKGYITDPIEDNSLL